VTRLLDVKSEIGLSSEDKPHLCIPAYE
jgi:hypothetical protein